jgi:hypothetical protein
MRLSHKADEVSAIFDDPDLVSHAGLVPVMRLAESAGLPGTADELLTLGGPAGSNAGAKIASIVAGMAAGADSIDDLDVLRHGALPELFGGIRAPSTLGTFLRHYTFGHVSQLEKTSGQVLGRLGAQAPGLLPTHDSGPVFLDLDSKITQVYGPGKEGARFGYTKVRGLNFLTATLSGTGSAPVITGTRLRAGNADTRRGATSFLEQNLTTVRRDLSVTAPLHVRMDSGFYVGKVIKAITSAGHLFSVTVPQRTPIRAAIAAIPEHAWTTITYDEPVYDGETRQRIRTAEIAVTHYTAFTNPTTNPGQRITADLVARRTPATTTDEQGELFTTWRYHAIFTNIPADPVTVEARHRRRAGAIEQVFADLNDSALAHFPSGRFAANAAWLTLAALTHNLLRAAGHLTSAALARARTGTIRRRLVTIAARATRARTRLRLHLPQNWPWAEDYLALLTATHHPPHTV